MPSLDRVEKFNGHLCSIYFETDKSRIDPDPPDLIFLKKLHT